MAENKWDNFGEQIKSTVDHAIREGDFTDLSRSIGNIINDTVDSVKKSVKTANSKRAQGPYPIRQPYQGTFRETHRTGNQESSAPVLYQRTPQGRVTGILMAVAGYAGMVIFGVVLLMFWILGMITGAVLPVTYIVFSVLSVICLILGINGSLKLGFVSRFRGYIRMINRQLYVPIQTLAEKSGKSVRFITDDLKKMIDNRMFLEAHIDEENHYLILSDQAYRDYIAAKKEYQQRQRAAEEAQRMKEQLPADCQKLIEEGEAYIRHIHWCNDQIPGVEISAKLDQMENVITRIFAVVREHPEVAQELGKLMSYYLPTTRKLLDTYRELDHQLVAGENILSTKREIEATFDTLNTAFEKLLDSLYEDKAWDISSDISVLNTVLAQDGLKEDEMKKSH